MTLRPALFLDRDGVLMDDDHYVDSIDRVRIIPGAAGAIRRANGAGWVVVVVSNQSGVARGLMTEEQVENIHRYLTQQFMDEGSRIDRFYFCPHQAEHGIGQYKIDCDCRKPKAGMLKQAAEDFGIDLGASWLVGDRLSDLQAAKSAGCKCILVRTGYGMNVELEAPQDELNLVAIVPSIAEAIEVIFR